MPGWAAILLLAAALRAEAPPGWVRVWGDEFDGREIDLREWVIRTDSKLASTQLAANVSLRDGCLVLAGRKEAAGGKAYTGGGVISRREFTRGYFEARMRYPVGAGWHGSFWLQMHDGSGGTGPGKTLQEMDIVETDTHNLNRYSTSIHRWNPQPVKMGIRSASVTTPDLSADFHTWGCLWGEQEAVMSFDGKAVLTVPTGDFPQGPQQVWLTMIAVKASKQGVDESKLPVEMRIDHVRVFSPPPAR